MTHKELDHEDCDDPKGQGQPPPYSESSPSDATYLPPTETAPDTTIHTSTSTAVGASVTVVTGQPTYPTGVLYQGNTAFVPIGTNIGQGPFIGPKESPMTCPSCEQRITTKVEYKASTRTHMCALMFCMVGFLPCMIIPYCLDSCRNTNHYCPECNAFLGTYIPV